MQYHLTRYAFLFESTMLADATTLAPPPAAGIEDGPGLKATLEAIDNRADFKVFMQNYAYAHGGTQKGPRERCLPRTQRAFQKKGVTGTHQRS